MTEDEVRASLFQSLHREHGGGVQGSVRFRGGNAPAPRPRVSWLRVFVYSCALAYCAGSWLLVIALARWVFG